MARSPRSEYCEFMDLTNPNPGNITDVQDSRTKGLLRGLLAREVDETTYATYNNLRVATPAADAEKVSRLLLSSPLFAHLRLVDDFPAEPPTPSHFRDSSVQTLHNEIVFQGVRIGHNADRLTAALIDLKTLNDHLLEARADQTIDAFKDFIRKYGYSLLLLTKLAYARAIFDGQEAVLSYCSSELDKFGAKRRNAIALGAIDMMGELYDFIPLRRNLLDFANSKNTTRYTRDILNWQFRPIRFLRNDLASQLQSHGFASALDALAFILIHRHSVDVLPGLGLAALVDKYVPSRVREE
jgi:hypothetical protein